ncbi:AI-2E family transporter, partial [Escherichia coli]|nr:AI-2E family transporter [Escherichia coli]
MAYLPWLILIPILAFFLLKDAESFRRSALQMIPQGRLRWRGDEFFQDVNRTLAAYIRAQLIACLLIGTICTIG